MGLYHVLSDLVAARATPQSLPLLSCFHGCPISALVHFLSSYIFSLFLSLTLRRFSKLEEERWVVPFQAFHALRPGGGGRAARLYDSCCSPWLETKEKPKQNIETRMQYSCCNRLRRNLAYSSSRAQRIS